MQHANLPVSFATIERLRLGLCLSIGLGVMLADRAVLPRALINNPRARELSFSAWSIMGLRDLLCASQIITKAGEWIG